ncbi:MAG: ABC transporter ATP-binding protein [Porticoccus sp.]|uniref:ABC transporter ATP-binding protein n=1 Tax=Porticoccus sp. TaxID=2024853 RepID=UPI003297C4D9
MKNAMQYHQSIIRLEDVYKTYRRGSESVEVLSDISLSIKQGDFVSIMGPSGSGKSTLLNIIGGLDKPTQGSVNIGDVEINSFHPDSLADWRGKNLGFIFQFYNLIPVLNALDNVALPLTLHPMKTDQMRKMASIALALVGLEERSKHYPSELSGGQQQRVAIARAIVAAPDIILCDEPTGDLDRESALGILQLLKHLNEEEGKTIVMVTHDNEAASFASRHLTIRDGQFTEAVEV